jgi:hypothetical protein
METFQLEISPFSICSDSSSSETSMKRKIILGTKGNNMKFNDDHSTSLDKSIELKSKEKAVAIKYLFNNDKNEENNRYTKCYEFKYIKI